MESLDSLFKESFIESYYINQVKTKILNFIKLCSPVYGQQQNHSVPGLPGCVCTQYLCRWEDCVILQGSSKDWTKYKMLSNVL